MSLNLLIIYICGHLVFPSPAVPICTFGGPTHHMLIADSFVFAMKPDSQVDSDLSWRHFITISLARVMIMGETDQMR